VRIKDVIKYIWEEGGWKGFFKGNYSNCFKVAPETAIRFYMFDYLKNRYSQDN
jgi:solute carrier family 25 (mitochondrial phosphate transporter), member 23/24/25/41